MMTRAGEGISILHRNMMRTTVLLTAAMSDVSVRISSIL